MSRILVTGASGFVGRHLVAALRARGEHVIEHSSAEGDLARLEPDYPDIRHVFHLAGRTYVPNSWSNPLGFYEVNVLGTVNVLEFCRKAAASVTLLSSYVYGRPETLPIPEDHPLKAFNPYANSKILAEEAARFYQEVHKVPITIVRAFNLYGPGQARHFLIPSLVAQALEPDGESILVQDDLPRRDYIFIGDLVELLLLLDKRARGVYNAGFGTSFSVREVVSLIISITGTSKRLISRNRPRPDEVMDTIADVRRAKCELNWTPRTTLESGLRRTIESILVAPEWPKHTVERTE